MKKAKADALDLLDETGRSIDSAILEWDRAIADAHDAKTRALRAWRDWDLDALKALGILNDRQAADVGRALVEAES